MRLLPCYPDMVSTQYNWRNHENHFLAAAALLAASQAAQAHGIESAVDPSKPAAFDITSASATTDGRLSTFMMEVAGEAGSVKPEATGKVQGAKVTAYVWPTGFDPSAVGFAEKSGILALAITAHPDFDDTPLFDENGDGDPANDGAGWHSHWVVLEKADGCGAGLKVRDVSPGSIFCRRPRRCCRWRWTAPACRRRFRVRWRRSPCR